MLTAAVAVEPLVTQDMVRTCPADTLVTSGAVIEVVSVFPLDSVGSSLEEVNSVTAAAVEFVDLRRSNTTDPVVDAVPAPICAPRTVTG